MYLIWLKYNIILFKVSPAALTYEPTDNIMKLATVPERKKNLPKPLEPGTVPKSALRYKSEYKINIKYLLKFHILNFAFIHIN